MLASCYRRSLELAVEKQVRTIAFPAISTGVYGFPLERATQIAVETVSHFLEENALDIKVVFVCFSAQAYQIYQKIIELQQDEENLSAPPNHEL